MLVRGLRGLQVIVTEERKIPVGASWRGSQKASRISSPTLNGSRNSLRRPTEIHHIKNSSIKNIVNATAQLLLLSERGGYNTELAAESNVQP